MVEAATDKDKVRPFKPSLIDWFQNWVDGLQVRPWVFYAAVGIVLILVQVIVLLAEGGMHAEELLPVLIFNALGIALLLGLMHRLDSSAVAALNTMRPMLDITESEFDRFEYKLANMRSYVPLVVGLGMAGSLILAEQVFAAPLRYAALEQLPVFAVVYHIIDKITAFFMGIYIYHSIRQLRLIYAVNSSPIRIKLFNLGPLQSFSRVTALTAVGLVVGMYGWMIINPELMLEPFTMFFVVFFTMLAVSVFALPLYCVHKLIEEARENELREIDLRFEVAFSKFNRRFGDEEFSSIEELNGTIASLEIQRGRVKEIDTWPWGSETVRFALSVIALPLILTVLRFLIEALFGW